VGRVKERPEAQPPGSKLMRIQSASFSILPNGMLDWRGSRNFGKHGASNKFRCHGQQKTNEAPPQTDEVYRLARVV
jgi:hypothetical protein